MLVPVLVALSLFGASDAKLLQAQQLLDAKDCDGLAGLFQTVKREDPRQDLATARFLVQAATECRKKDKILALGLSQKASRLAPDDYGVTTSEAESFIALDQRGEASRILDDTIVAHPNEAARARLLRGQIADLEHDWAVAAQVLKPLAEDPQYGPQAQEILARANQGLQADAQAIAQLKQSEAQAEEMAKRGEEIATARGRIKGMARSGTQVWAGRGTVKTGGSRTWLTKNIKAGTHYVLHAMATCKGPKKSSSGGRRRGRSRAPTRAITFGLNFKAIVGSLDPIPLDADVGTTRNDHPFRALEDNPQIRVEDMTDSEVNVKCSITDVSVRVP